MWPVFPVSGWEMPLLTMWNGMKMKKRHFPMWGEKAV
jgi:hypothetical protein